MDKKPFFVDLVLDSVYITVVLVDNGTTAYVIINECFARRLKLLYINIRPRKLTRIVPVVTGDIEWMTYASIDVDGHYQHRVFFYVMPGQEKDVILGLAWIEAEEIRLDTGHNILEIESTEMIVREKNQKASVLQMLYPQELFNVHITAEICRARKKSNNDVKIFVASIKDIEKILRKKKEMDP